MTDDEIIAVAGRDIRRVNIDGVYSCVCVCLCWQNGNECKTYVRRLVVVLRRFFYTQSINQSIKWMDE